MKGSASCMTSLESSIITAGEYHNASYFYVFYICKCSCWLGRRVYSVSLNEWRDKQLLA
jgi:hypothetical protein